MPKSLLVLEDGNYFEGESFGKGGTTLGEICFNTAMTGYQEIFSDPSYLGQILVMTNVHIGNYGFHNDDDESDGLKIRGLICRNLSSYTSRVGSKCVTNKLGGVVGISGVDTRALVSHIRSKGAMNCVISSEIDDISQLKSMAQKHPKMSGQNLSEEVTRSRVTEHQGGDLKVALIDFGCKESIVEMLSDLGVTFRIFPSDFTLADISSWKPDGYLLSNGPGDPSSMSNEIANVKEIIKSGKPVFGICLGHQLLGLALGHKTYKLKIGHRGGNHPIQNLETGLCEITTQNHGFCLVKESIEKDPNLVVTHIHLNDDTIAGIRHKSKPLMSVQFHPEAGPGPNDSKYLFQNFIKLIQDAKK